MHPLAATVTSSPNAFVVSRSEWPNGLRHETSSTARTQGLWARLPLEAWIFVCDFYVFMCCVILYSLTTG
jgi:hypothetical protein